MPDLNTPTISCEIAFSTTGPLTVPGSWTDVSTYLRTDDLSIRRGRADELQATQAGILTCVLRNADRRFEPEYASGAYYPNVVPQKRIRISAVWNAVTYRLFTGLITRWTPSYDAATGQEIVTVQAVDLLGGILANIRNTANNGNLFTGTSMISALNAAGVDAADRNIAQGDSIIQLSGVSQTTSVADNIQRAAFVEWMPVWCAGDGRITFVNRETRYNPATPTVQIGGAGNPQASELTLLYDGEQYLYTTVRVTRTSGVEQTATDAAAAAIYGAREKVLTLEARDDAEAAALADHILTLYKAPKLRIQAIKLIPETSPSTLWPIALGTDVGTRVRVSHTPKSGGSALVQDCFVESLALSIRGAQRAMVWTLSPAALSDLTAWELEDATWGVLDSTTRVVY